MTFRALKILSYKYINFKNKPTSVSFLKSNCLVSFTALKILNF